jgi:phage head maturation protease
MRYCNKKYDLKAVDLDNKTKSVKIAFSEMVSVDRDGDLILPTAFDKTFKERGPQGTNEIWHMLDHGKNSFSALSKFKELWRNDIHAGGVSHYKNSFAWREVAWPIYEAGEFTQHSIGFNVVKEHKSEGHNVIEEVQLYEGSAVLWGANPNTPTHEVVKALLGKDEDREITAAEKIDEIIKKIRNDKYSDDNSSLLIIELKRLQWLFDTKQISKVFEEATEPEITTTLPDRNEEEVKAALNLLILKHF